MTERTKDVSELISAAISLTEKVMSARGVAEIDRASVAASGFVAKGLLTDLVDLLEAEHQRADEMTEQYLDRNSALTSSTLRYEKAEAELSRLKTEKTERELRLEGVITKQEAELAALRGTQEPVGELVAWNKPGEERKVDFRFLRFDAPAGTKLYADQPKPVVVLQAYEPRTGGDYEVELIGRQNGEVYLVSDVKAALESAGIAVKDGE